jgi:hypothetical protein
MPMTKEEEIQLYLNCVDSIESEEEKDEDQSDETPRAIQENKKNPWNLLFAEKSLRRVCEINLPAIKSALSDSSYVFLDKS